MPTRMVSKSKILGKSTLILVTVGSTNFNFDRVFKVIDELLLVSKTRPLLIVQKANSKYAWKYTNIIETTFLKPNILIEKIKQADKIISHAGPGNLFLLTHYARYQPFIIPRLSSFQEHIDDHQVYFANFLRKKFPKKIHPYFYIEGNLKECTKIYLSRKNRINTLKDYLFKENIFLLKNLHQYIQAKHI